MKKQLLINNSSQNTEELKDQNFLEKKEDDRLNKHLDYLLEEFCNAGERCNSY